MPIYNCEKCNKHFKQKIDYTRHINRINSCINTTEAQKSNTDKEKEDFPKLSENGGNSSKLSENEESKSNVCKYCNKEFTNIYNAKRHMDSRCKVNKKQKEDNNTLLQKLMEEMEAYKKKVNKLEEENKELKEKIGSININSNNTINNTINNNNTINIIAFGKEDLNKIIDEKTCKQWLKGPFDAVPKMIEQVHFDKAKPEYHNCFISNLSKSHGMIYDGNYWKVHKITQLVDDIKEKGRDYLERKFDDFYDSLSEKEQDRFRRFLDDIDNKDEYIEEQKLALKFLLYGKCKIAMETKKKKEKLDKQITVV